MRLTGHKGSVYALQYDPSGEALVSASFDMTCLLWDANYENYNVLQGHKNAILDVKWSCDSQHVATASADKTVGWWHANTGQRVKRLQGHSEIVNAVDTCKTGTAPLFASASDDHSVILWDARVRGGSVGELQHDFPVTAVAYGDTSVYSGGLDNCIYEWDIRTLQRKMSMKGHKDTITCLSLHPKQTQLLSNSMDGTLKSWDIQPFASDKRNLKTFCGGTHNAEKGLLKCAWSPDGTMVSGGSADRMVHIWDELTSEEVSVCVCVLNCVYCIMHACFYCIVCLLTTHCTLYFHTAVLASGTHGMCQHGGLSSKGECNCLGIF